MFGLYNPPHQPFSGKARIEIFFVALVIEVSLRLSGSLGSHGFGYLIAEFYSI
jgi:hypothetical protein